MSASWIQVLIAAISGGVVVKILDLISKQYWRKSDEKKEIEYSFEDYLDRILKSADKLHAKILSLARSDFASLQTRSKKTARESYLYLVFLFAQFWGELALLERESITAQIYRIKKGRKLLKFMKTFEEKKTSIVDRPWQIAVGEYMIGSGGTRHHTIPFIDFCNQYESNDGNIRTWLAPLEEVLQNAKHKSKRQVILFFGAILQAMIDCLDPKYQIAGKRPGYPNKLNKKNRFELQHRVFKEYLKFVAKPEKYYKVTDK